MKKVALILVLLLLALSTTWAAPDHNRIEGEYPSYTTAVGNACPSGVKINEVRPFGQNDPLGGFMYAFVELYNRDTVPVSLAGWELLNRNGSTIANLPAWILPPGAFLTIYFGDGTDDNDFSDNLGHFYTQGSSDVFGTDVDELGLYSAAPSANTLVDFVSWSNTGTYAGGLSYAHAISQELWPSGGFVNRSGHGMFSTLGLCPDGYDHDTPADWREYEWGTYFLNTIHGGPNPIQMAPRDGAVLPASQVSLTWAQIAYADGYRLQIALDSDFANMVLDISLTDTNYTVSLGLGDYFWRVLVEDNLCTVPEHAVWEFTRYQFLPPQPQPVLLNMKHFFQHKDTRMLCVSDENRMEKPVIRRPGCLEAAGRSGPWDQAHPLDHALNCEHCANYCVRASIAMVNDFYGGTLSQDRISYHTFRDFFKGPEQDLGHERGLWINEITPTYSWALNGAAVTFHNGKPTFTKIVDEIDAGRPVAIVIPGHMMVLSGYNYTNNQVYVLDPWPGGQTGWQRYSRVRITGYWTIPDGAVAGRMQENTVTMDSDGDNVVDFDEQNRFCSKANLMDSDWDEVPDQKDIRSYTFHDSDHGGHNNDAPDFPDPDGDGYAECDCDSDNDADFDGGEDINGNGQSPQSGETCVYDAGSKLIGVKTDKAVYLVGEPIVFSGGTLHGNSTYTYDLIPNCPDLKDSTQLQNDGTITTDMTGKFSKIIPPVPPGKYLIVADVLKDQWYSEPDNWDPYTCFEVIAPISMECPADIIVVGTADFHGAIVNFPDPIATTVCPDGGLVISLVDGLPSGSIFPYGITEVCFLVTDLCGNETMCCFVVQVDAPLACDEKTIGCIKYELLGITKDGSLNPTFRIRVTNNCPESIVYTAFQLPKGMIADAPASNSLYLAPSGREYLVRNPNFSPVYSIRFSSVGAGIGNGESDIFEYTLPAQASPAWIYAITRLSPRTYLSAHLNTYGCEDYSDPTGNRSEQAGQGMKKSLTEPVQPFHLFPNPAIADLYADLSPWAEQQVRVRLMSAQGQTIQVRTVTANKGLTPLHFDPGINPGLYWVQMTNEAGETQVKRIVWQRL